MEFPKTTPMIGAVRELAAEDILGLEREVEPRQLSAIRDSHHAVARAVAAGLRTGLVAQATGYSITRIQALKKDPAFQQLVAEKQALLDETWVEGTDAYYELVNKNRTLSARLINDKLTAIEDPAEIDLRTLVAIHADSADRTGYPKRTESINVNLGFAARLDLAVRRSGQVLKEVTGSVIEGEGVPLPSTPRRV